MENTTYTPHPLLRQTLGFLDGLRGLAALYVMIGHARWLLWEGYQAYLTHPAQYTTAGKALVYGLALFRYGHEAVLVFFILSGFLIHNSYARKLSANASPPPFDYANYVGRRAKRILPPLLLGLLLTYGLDTVGTALGYSIYSQHTPSEQINQNVISHLDGRTLLGNLLFLETAYVPVWGSNGPLWSLMYEWWFYLLYPLFYALNRRGPLRSLLAVAAVSALCWLAGEPYLPKILSMVGSYWLCWVLGTLLADVLQGRLRITTPALTGLSMALLPYSMLGRHLPAGAVADTLLAVALTGLLAGLLWVNQTHARWLGPLVRLRWLGNSSYTLYVTHFPILVLLNGWVLSTTDNALPASFGYVLVGILLVLSIAYLLHFFTEVPFTKKRQKPTQLTGAVLTL